MRAALHGRVLAATAQRAPEPRLPLQAEAAAQGAFSANSHIQGLNTRGGLAPTAACVTLQSVRVASTADPFHFRSQP
jgi:hypothetical protein